MDQKGNILFMQGMIGQRQRQTHRKRQKDKDKGKDKERENKDKDEDKDNGGKEKYVVSHMKENVQKGNKLTLFEEIEREREDPNKQKKTLFILNVVVERKMP
jgi:hypothetical protein